MFARLFSDSGLSLDRLRTLVEVGAAGTIVRASGGDPVRQSQYSRQIKELEDFFQAHLVERRGKGVLLTSSGRELARISRFFLLGLSNFQRGCLAERQTYRVGASGTVIRHLLLPVLAGPETVGKGPVFALQTAESDEIERRLHDLTLDFGIVTAESLSRPLQVTGVGTWSMRLWSPMKLYQTERSTLRALDRGWLPLAMARELPSDWLPALKRYQPRLTCDSYLDAKTGVEQEGMGAFLPDFLRPVGRARDFLKLNLPGGAANNTFTYRLAWNPRLMRLNVHAVKTRDALVQSLTARMASLDRS